MTTPQIHTFDSIWSTNSKLASLEMGYPHGTVFSAYEQTAGVGQRGNSWEAEPGKNLTFSILLRPRTITPAESFSISMLTALSITNVIGEYLSGKKVKIKWPNDIYVGDEKLCGILIENSFCGQAFNYSIVGVGINVNQTEFLSDAPNPVSMANLTGESFNLSVLLNKVCQRILDDFDDYELMPDINALTAEYRAKQWRGTGIHKWIDVAANKTIDASIASISPDGYLTLATNPPRRYAFKEIVAVI